MKQTVFSILRKNYLFFIMEFNILDIIDLSRKFLWMVFCIFLRYYLGEIKASCDWSSLNYEKTIHELCVRKPNRNHDIWVWWLIWTILKNISKKFCIVFTAVRFTVDCSIYYSIDFLSSLFCAFHELFFHDTFRYLRYFQEFSLDFFEGQQQKYR